MNISGVRILFTTVLSVLIVTCVAFGDGGQMPFFHRLKPVGDSGFVLLTLAGDTLYQSYLDTANTDMFFRSGDGYRMNFGEADTVFIDSLIINEWISLNGSAITAWPAAGGMDSAEVMTVIRDTTYVDTALTAQIVRDTITAMGIAGGLDSAEVMTVIRDTTYIDSALVAIVARDSSFLNDTTIAVRDDIRDTVTAMGLSAGLDSAEVMTIIRDTTYVDSTLVALIARDSSYLNDTTIAVRANMRDTALLVVTDSSTGVREDIRDTVGVLDDNWDAAWDSIGVWDNGVLSTTSALNDSSAAIRVNIRDTVTAMGLSAGLDSAEVMTILRDTTYADSTLTAIIARDSSYLNDTTIAIRDDIRDTVTAMGLSAGLDSAEVMVILRDTTYADSALVAIIARDSSYLNDTTIAIRANIRDTVTAMGISGGLDSAEVMTVVRDTAAAVQWTVPEGGTGAATFTDHGVLLGSAAGAITVLTEAPNGYLIIGETGSDPSLAAITETGDALTVTNGAASIDLAVHANLEQIADGTITTNLVNTTSPWADDEIASSTFWNTLDDSSSAIRDDVRDTVTAMGISGGLDSAQIMTVIRDTTYADSALVAIIARDSSYLNDTTIAIRADIRDTVGVLDDNWDAAWDSIGVWDNGVLATTSALNDTTAAVRANIRDTTILVANDSSTAVRADIRDTVGVLDDDWEAAWDSIGVWDNGVLATTSALEDSIPAVRANIGDTVAVSQAGDVDTTGTEIVAALADRANAHDTLTKSFVIAAIDDTFDFPFWMTIEGVTIIAANGVCIAGTNVIGCLMEYDANAANPAVCNSSDWTFTTGEERTTSVSNASIDAGDYLGWKTTSVSGTVTFFTLTIEYVVN